MKKRLAAASLITLTLLVSACGGNNNSTSDNTSSNASNSSGNASNSGSTSSNTSSNQSAATNTSDAAKPDPFGKFDQPVVLNIAKAINTKSITFPNGDSVDNNEFYRWIEKKLNVQVKNAWQVETADAYDQKMGVSIASRDLPDAFIVNEQQLKQLVQADLIEDLTQAYKDNASDLIKGYYDSYDDRVLGRATFDGKLMALPNTNIGQQYNIMWIRQDWLDKYGLKAPTTVDELINVAKTFIDNDADGHGKHDTLGISGVPSLAGWNNFAGFDPIMGAYHATFDQWVKDADGNVVYSSTLPEMKAALGKLHEMYDQGIIDKQFAIRKDPAEVVANNQVGIAFGPWWIPYWPLEDSVKNDPKAEWKPYIAPLDGEGKFYTGDQDPTNQFLVVRKGYEHPDAVVRVLNEEYQGIRKIDPEAAQLYADHPEVLQHWELWPYTLQVGPETTVYDTHAQAQAAVDAKDDSKLDVELKGWYKDYFTNQANPKKDVAVWANASARFEGAALMNDNKVVLSHNLYFGKTKSMQTKWSILQKLEDETFLKIIMGEQPLDSFDKFVDQWNSLGGKQITKEVTDEINSK
ncbi:carbohydrate ABC transporter substrate-binding protein (CUT1 family) [Paenibacillus taihuensis]|uniref:Carbohydrate ABC transporter substrate-binding protein (CUT1 family) n=1 Tax=Paenibacillus taihuensis TaxID=1156355 RepID=A0A3D9S9H2_9BACL|nr:extracellular solute-binding protein [Paenibacillus taihuensis]REE87456.1 carbohydrate ABC transporter substrate-binding protein (CUT1 family) [Paenibacillus taihuensis]